MKRFYIYLSIFAVVTTLIASCNKEWEDEQYEQYISFKAPIPSGGDGVTDIYVRYNEGGKVTYRLPIIVSGSTDNAVERDVHIAVDSDTLAVLNEERFSLVRPELWYTELEESMYDFPEVVNIPAGENKGILNIDFSLSGIDMLKKWVLPLTIVDDPSYNYVSHPRKNYAKALLHVIPFNDYSGSYNSGLMEVYVKNTDGTTEKNAITEDKRTGYVVNDNTIFFIAGLIGEDLDEDTRRVYKVNVVFNDDETLDISPADPENKMNFKLNGTPTYSVQEIKDSTKPYLLHKYIQLRFEYEFEDVTTNPDAPIGYLVTGSMTLQRDYNTQIPDEDQQIQWN